MTHAVILAGGWGERLWPMSTRSCPKQLLRLVAGESLCAPRCGGSRPSRGRAPRSCSRGLRYARRSPRASRRSAAARHRGARGRNTAPAVALAAHLLVADDPDAVMVVLPADHVVSDDAAFRAAVDLAVRAALTTRGLVTLGVRPTRPETEYGYVRVGGNRRSRAFTRSRNSPRSPTRKPPRRSWSAEGTSGTAACSSGGPTASSMRSRRGSGRAPRPRGRPEPPGRRRVRRSGSPLRRCRPGRVRRLRRHGEGARCLVVPRLRTGRRRIMVRPRAGGGDPGATASPGVMSCSWMRSAASCTRGWRRGRRGPLGHHRRAHGGSHARVLEGRARDVRRVVDELKRRGTVER